MQHFIISKKLKEAGSRFIKKIRISKDITVEEREEEKKLVNALWEKRNQGDNS